MVANCYVDGEWRLDFRSSLTETEALELTDLLAILQPVQLIHMEDEVEWSLDKSRNFTTKSLYRFSTHRGVCVKNSDNLWKTKLPLKIKVFLWQLSHNKLQSAVALKKRGWKGDPYCCLCGRLETTKHIFFSCSLARFVWSGVGLAFSRDTIPKSLDDLQVGGIVVFFKTNMRLGFIMFAGFAWAL